MEAADQESTNRFTVDAALCQRATDELHAILLQQEHSFFKRWYGSRFYRYTFNTMRALGLLLTAGGLILSVVLLATSAFSELEPVGIGYVLLLVCFFLFFIFLPRLLPTIHTRLQIRMDKRCRRRAAKAIRIAKQLAPYEADYDLKGDLLVYSRGKEGEWKLAWFRKLKKFQARGLAIQGKNISAIFNRSTSLYPAIIVLHESAEWFGSALQNLSIAQSAIEIDTNA